MTSMTKHTLIDCFSLRARIGWQGLRSDEFKTEGPYLVTGVDFHNGRVDWDDCYHVTEERYAQDKGIQLHEHDLLITKDGTIGKTAVVIDCPKKATLNSGVFVVRAISNEVVPEFLHYVLHSHWFDLFVRNVLTGSTIKHLNQEKFYKFSFEAPGVPIQKKIVEVLESVDTTINETRDVLQKKLHVRDGLIQALLQNGIDKEGNIRSPETHLYKESPIGLFPVDWDIVQIGTIASKVGSGATPRGGESVYTNEGVLFIRSQDVTHDGLVLQDVARIPVSIHNRMKRSRVMRNDVLLNITGASIGRSCVYDLEEAANVNQHVCIIRLDKDFDTAYLLHKWLFSYGQRQIRILMTGSNREGLNFDQIKKIYFPLIRDVAEVNRISAILHSADEGIEREKSTLKKYLSIKHGLMQDLLSNEVDVSEIL